MADPLSIVASSIAVIQAANAIISFCKGYVEAVRDASSDFRKIVIEVLALKSIFERLKYFTEVGDIGSSPMLLNILGQDGPIQGCERCITAIQAELASDITGAAEEPTEDEQEPGKKLSRLTLPFREKGKQLGKRKWGELGTALSGLRWPLKKGKVLRLLEEVAEYKTTINLAMASENMGEIKHMKKQIQEVHEQLSNSELHDICDWLVETNPSTLYNTSRDQYTPGTGNWALRSTGWTDWISGKIRSLWVHGIPGAGKTVLAGYLIHEIQKICNNADGDRVTSAYYYCHHARNQDERVPMLKWVISQLSRTSKFVAPGLLRAYEQRHQPSANDLLDSLANYLKHFKVVYLVIDALDESQEWQPLLEILTRLVTESRFERIRLLTTSREYPEFEMVLSKLSTELSMSNPLVEEDIRIHVSHKLRAERRFKDWSIELLGEVEDELAEGAQGMFRWAVCQIDILKRIRPPSMHNIREALESLPKTLDETYDRIFSLIKSEDQDLVRHALAWICFQGRLSYDDRVTPSVLLESFYRTQKDDPYVDGHCRFTRDDLQEMCGCLLTFQLRNKFNTEFESVFLAHYTVREYLSSERILQGPASVYGLKPSLDEAFMDTIFKTVQGSKLTAEEVRGFERDDIIRDLDPYCIQASCLCLQRLESDICRSDHLTTLVFNFLYSSLELVQACLNSIAGTEDNLGDYLHYQYDHSENDQVDATCLGVLLQLSAYKVAEAFSSLLRNRGTLQSILSTTITVGFEFTNAYISHPAHRYYDEGRLLEVSGSLLDILAQVGKGQDCEFLLQRTHDAGVATKALILSVGTHCHEGEHRLEYDCKCQIQVALQAGADPNTRGVWATPLQIAVASRDLEGVQALVEAGADVDGLGDEGAGMWEKDTLMGRFNFLHDLSPLYICRIPKCICFRVEDFEEQMLRNRREIEELLLSRGAKETVRNGPYLDFEYRIDWNFEGEKYWARWLKGELLDDGRESDEYRAGEAANQAESDLE